ncbi:hypothetical protein ACI3PL_25510, partial [Lacticaseibacillus paracasei]
TLGARSEHAGSTLVAIGEERREEEIREEKKKTTPKEIVLVEIPQVLRNAPGFIEAWRDWKDSRSKKYKPQGEKSQLTRLAGMGPER